MDILNTGIRNVRNVSRYNFGVGSIDNLRDLLYRRRGQQAGQVIFLVDSFFKNRLNDLGDLGYTEGDANIFVSTDTEPTTDYVDQIIDDLRIDGFTHPTAIVGIGGGIVMDVAKAISNLYTNPGRASDYQGWDLVKFPGVYKIAVPTISGTGSEASRTCVMTNVASGLKLGMNSDFTVYDHILMDPTLTGSVPRNQYFYTGMDAFIHCAESLGGSYRNAIGDAYSRETIHLCRQVFMDGDMMSLTNRERLMVASYLGGCAIATSYVGLVHPFSAGLSVVLGTHHCLANCVVMRAMRDFYPQFYDDFWAAAERQGVEIPKGVCQTLGDDQFDQLYEATIIHEKPLSNALGYDFKRILTREKVFSIFSEM